MKRVLVALIIIGAGGLYLLGGQTEPAKVTTPDIQVEEEKEVGIIILPARIVQGDPVKIEIEGVSSVEEIASLTLDGKKLSVFVEENKPAALVGIDLRGRVGKYSLVLTLKNGKKLESEFIVNTRTIATAPLGIPDKLGGNTPQSEQTLVNTLVEEGRIISAVPSGPDKLWEGEFIYPVGAPVIVTDTYGYSRQTGGSSISHKGTDYRAAVGTSVYAMNSGLVGFVDHLRNYGNTIIIDHGLGLHTIYMHLSEIDVKVGDKVSKGQVIAKSGDTGYVLGPHLHLTIRISGISIDPEKFLTLFGS